MFKRTLGCVALTGWLMATGSLLAHHSLAGVYDMKGEKEVAGAVEKVQFVNPHGSLTIGVKGENGTTTPLCASAVAEPSVNTQGVVVPNALRVGDAIKVKYIPAKDGSPLGFLKSVTYPDGHTIVVSGGGPND